MEKCNYLSPNKKKQCRFSELERLMPNCSRRMLSLQLNQLLADRIINKTTYPTVPPKTNYQLTNLGKTLTPLILEMEKWGEEYNKSSQN